MVPGIVVSLCLFIAALAQGAQEAQIDWMGMDRATLTVVVDLASEASAADAQGRDRILDQLYEQMERVHAERVFSQGLFDAPPDAAYTTLVAADGDHPVDYLLAIGRSFARFRGAEAAGDRAWMAQHWTAAKHYAALAAQGLLAQAKLDEEDGAKLQTTRFAMRRPPEQAAVFAERLKRDGLSAEHRKLLQESGSDEKEIDTYQKAVQATPPGELGLSIVELYTYIARFRRAAAASLETFAGARSMESGPLSQTYLVGNPHDREETIDLFIRRASVPPEWKLSIIDAETTPDGKPQKLVREVEAGRHYQVQLPAHGRTTVASVVVPVGIVAEHTTARWAVEGKIRDELIGGMVHEMHVPGFLPDLKLPPITPTAASLAAGAPPVAAQPRWVMPAAIAAAALLAITIVVVLLVRSRRRATGP